MACITPIRIRAKRKSDIGYIVSGFQMVPCGKCNKCKLKRVNDWVIRLLAEERTSYGALFVTLTYAPEHVPLTAKGLMTIRKSDIQKFFKRLRFNTKSKIIKYYVAAEYGSQTFRPHYHAIIYNARADDIDKAWGLGETHFGTVTGDSIGYSLKYISKERQVPRFFGDDRQREFSLSSQNLGRSYLTPEMVEYHKDTLNNYIVKEGGYKAGLPRYYREKIFNQAEKDIINARIQARASVELQQNLSYYGDFATYHQAVFNYIIDQKRILREKHQNDRGTI